MVEENFKSIYLINSWQWRKNVDQNLLRILVHKYSNQLFKNVQFCNCNWSSLKSCCSIVPTAIAEDSFKTGRKCLIRHNYDSVRGRQYWKRKRVMPQEIGNTEQFFHYQKYQQKKKQQLTLIDNTLKPFFLHL